MHRVYLFFSFFLGVYEQINNGDDESVEESRSQQTAENHFCHGTLYLVAGQVAAQCQRNEGQGTAEGRHQNGVEAVQRTSDDAVVDRISFFTLQVVVVADEQHAVAGGDAEQRYEADDGRDAHFAGGQQQGKDASDEGQRQVDENDGTLLDAAELVVEQQEDDDDGHQ